jgi:hypothetical protein
MNANVFVFSDLVMLHLKNRRLAPEDDGDRTIALGSNARHASRAAGHHRGA